MSIRFVYEGPSPALAERELLARRIADFHEAALRPFRAERGTEWTLRLGGDLLFDEAGLCRLAAAVASYHGSANVLELRLLTDPTTWRDYYSLHGTELVLPVVATRRDAAGSADRIEVRLPSTMAPIPFPASLAPAAEASVPHALLTAYRTDFDLLFANQMGLVSRLRRRAPRSPAAWIRALRPGGHPDWRQRLALSYRRVHPTAYVHPTAVVEASEIGAGAHVGAHCTVRYSIVGERARVHDGAKVELSVVGAGSWLMHDLVLYRSHAESEVFLIHGPYQFASFQARSAAFATILMDYRPDDRPIRVAGAGDYAGRFLGSVLRPGAKTLGGSLLAPGSIVPAGVWLGSDPQSVHARITASESPTSRPLPPSHWRRAAPSGTC